MIRKKSVVVRFFAILSLLVVISTNGSNASRILCLFTTPATSHHIVFRAYTKALLEQGHELVVATTHPVENSHPNMSIIDWSNVREYWNGKVDFGTVSKQGLFGLIKAWIGGLTGLLDKELSHPQIAEIIKHPEKQNYDLVVVENHFTAMFEFGRLLKIPLLVICSSDPSVLEHEAVGNYVHSVAAPLRISATYGPMSFMERFKAKNMDILFAFLGPFFEKVYADVLKKHFGPDVRSMQEMASDIDLLLINVNPAFGYIRPITPKTITLGFMHLTEPKPLPSDLQSYLDESKHGVIYCSFGTNIHSEKFDEERLKTILDGFSRLKYDVLYKFGNDTVANKPKNVKLVKWAPQADLLAHKNVKLFITQGGQHSIEEAIYREIPLLAVPFFGDQHSNAKRIEGKELGKWLDIDTMTTDIFVNTIEEIINNPKYKENIAKLGEIVKDEPMSPTKKAVWWTEYLIRHKTTKHLEYPGVKVPTYQIYYLDVITVYIVILSILIYIIVMLVRLVKKLLNGVLTMACKIFSNNHGKNDKKSKDD